MEIGYRPQALDTQYPARGHQDTSGGFILTDDLLLLLLHALQRTACKGFRLSSLSFDPSRHGDTLALIRSRRFQPPCTLGTFRREFDDCHTRSLINEK